MDRASIVKMITESIKNDRNLEKQFEEKPVTTAKQIAGWIPANYLGDIISLVQLDLQISKLKEELKTWETLLGERNDSEE